MIYRALAVRVSSLSTSVFAKANFLCISRHISNVTDPAESCKTTKGASTPSSSLYLSFMGSSSRFTFASPIVTPADLTAIESEPLSHCPPGRINDHCCIYLVKLLRWCADKLFREHYLHRATMLKIIAPAAPFAGAIAAHLRMMFKRKGSPMTFAPGQDLFHMEMRGFLAQAESHACHAHFLMNMTEITYLERSVALFLQISHFAVFLLLFLFYPRMALRLMGYLGEESVVIWTHMINDIDLGKVTEREVPQLALKYWGLRQFKTVKQNDGSPHDAMPTDVSLTKNEKNQKDNEVDPRVGVVTLREMALLIRSDEMVWRDACHRVADEIDQERLKKKLSADSWFLM